MSDYLHQNNLQLKTFGGPAPAEGSAEVMEGMEGQEQLGGAGAPPSPMTLPKGRSGRAPSQAIQSCAPGFTMVDGDCKIFAKEYTPKMECPNYIGDTEMILRYLYHQERANKITMPIRACGIDPIVFDNVEHLDDGDGENPKPTNYFAILDEGEAEHEDDEDAVDHVYELIEVDNNLYLSCMSECLDPDYLHRIIAEATTTMRETGSYVFRMVGLRRLALGSDGAGGRLLETLRLNTFEMSALCSYMADFGAEPSFEIIDGHQCICFRSR